jgi:NADPH:quinone reductase and related Zn-dependent oxidoreductases
MKAVVISSYGGPEKLELQDVPLPEPQRGEVRIKVKATAVNRADVLQRMGKYTSPPDCPATVPGLEFAGEVDAIADGVDGYKAGDRVFGLVGGGSYAQYLTVHHRTLARIPEKLSFEEAAAIPEAFVTAYDAMVAQCNLSAGEWVLIHAVGSGVGTAAVQIAEAIGARSIGTSRTSEKSTE